LRELDAVCVFVIPETYDATNSVPFRSIACMMIARRRARAMRALRIPAIRGRQRHADPL
jgi:hypothetical protein